MDTSVINNFTRRLRVLTPHYQKPMDEMVEDLKNALDESSKAAEAASADSGGCGHQLMCPTHVVKIKRRGSRRRRPIASTLKLSPRLKGLVSPTRLSCRDASTSLLLACSEDSVSSLDESGVQKSSSAIVNARHSDSDCNGPCMVGSRPIAVTRIIQAQKGSPSGHFIGSFAESDSVNENFSPVRPHRRKRKFKRMAVDPVDTSVTELPDVGLTSSVDGMSPIQFVAHARSQRRLLNKSSGSPLALPRTCGALVEDQCSCNFGDILVKSSAPTSGKRKHSMRERSLEVMEAGDEAAILSLESVVISDASPNRSDPKPSTSTADSNMDVYEGDGVNCAITESGDSSSSCDGDGVSGVSGSESDAGIYTNDEGREGDDEQSDFYHEGGPDSFGPVCGISGVLPWWETQQHPLEDDEDETIMRTVLMGNLCSGSTRRPFDQNVDISCQLKPLTGREIRAGRRRLRDRRPGFSIISSMNEKISKFLQNPDQNELRLCPMKRKEMHQLGHLASLYSLNMRSEGSNEDKCPILTKTRNTTQVVNFDKIGVNSLWTGGQRRASVNAIKRCRRTPGANDFGSEVRMAEQSMSDQIHRSMNWESTSGQGSFLDRDSIKTSTVTQTSRSCRHQGQGFGPSASKSQNDR